jgi:hypothetical protein
LKTFERHAVMGEPDPAHVSTSYVERQNLTMRMSMWRFPRLTNSFSRKVENLAAAVSLHFHALQVRSAARDAFQAYPTTPGHGREGGRSRRVRAGYRRTLESS